MASPRIDADELLAAARLVRRRAYAPYSHYKVGAALLGKSGRVYTGCNVENASYGLALCAERNALAHAVAEGEREFLAIAITASGPLPVPPCGACRQVISELMPEGMVIAENEKRKRAVWTVDALLPFAFTKRFL